MEDGFPMLPINTKRLWFKVQRRGPFQPPNFYSQPHAILTRHRQLTPTPFISSSHTEVTAQFKDREHNILPSYSTFLPFSHHTCASRVTFTTSSGSVFPRQVTNTEELEGLSTVSSLQAGCPWENTLTFVCLCFHAYKKGDSFYLIGNCEH